jgi:LAGLIDADG endonuclease
MGQNIKFYSAIDYMLETTSLVICLLLITQYLRNNLDVSGEFHLLFNSPWGFLSHGPGESAVGEKDKFTLLKFLEKNRGVQSAENFLGFSETIRQLPSFPILGGFRDKEEENFFHWFAGIIDGDGNFEISKRVSGSGGRQGGATEVLKSIRIKLHNRDLRILTYIQNKLHMGRIRATGKKPHSIYIVSTQAEMSYIVSKLNGLIRLKVGNFKRACATFNIEFIEANYIIKENDPYFAGLIDTDGSIVFNYTSNRIECVLELKHNEYSSKLCLDFVIPHTKPSIMNRTHASPSKNNVIFKSISFKYQTVQSMVPVYDFFMKNRLYCDFKFYRISQIKKFIEIRHFKSYPFESNEYKLYSKVVLEWIQYRNPNWTKVTFVDKLNFNREREVKR